MKKTYIIYKEIPFYILLQDGMQNYKYTGMYIEEEEVRNYIFKSNDELYYYVKMQEENLDLLLGVCEEFKHQNFESIVRKPSLSEVSVLFSKYGKKLQLDKLFINISDDKSNIKMKKRIAKENRMLLNTKIDE